ncbi:MAG: hypothetical protein BZY88_10380 [SAR202 cluster bacterium Io17-Chloro-G9]|nr:MAG: hypothetical protein BZY88_10380 [SAR202 cluster bacterium Io17-Chloro-G9]
MRVELNWFRLKACVKCQGDLVWDEGDWLCLQCGRYYYTRLYQPEAIPDWQWDQPPRPLEEKATVLSPALLHSFRAVQFETVTSSLRAPRTISAPSETLVVAMGLGSGVPAKQ